MAGFGGAPSSASLPAFQWTNLSAKATGPAPSARSSAMMAYDAHDGYLVLFGGTNAAGYALADTWTYQNGTWTNLTSHSPTHPSARSDGGLAWDPSTSELVLFGGATYTGQLCNDTWTFSSGLWTNRTSGLSASPPALLAPTFTTDPSDNAVLLFGGASSRGPSGETWEWTQGLWKNLTATLSLAPSPRLWSDASNDPWDHGVLLFGGYNDNLSYFSDTWLFRGGAWTNLTPTVGASPPRNIEGALLLEGGNQSLVLADGLFVPPDGIPTLDPFEWAWHAGSWANVTREVPNPPSFRRAEVGADIAAGGGMGVTFGGLGTGTAFSDLELLYPPLRVNATVSPSVVLVGAPVHFGSNASGGMAPLNVTWTFGDGGRSFAASGNHSYAVGGSYPVRLNVTDDLGRLVSLNFSVVAYTGILVSVTAFPAPADVGSMVQLNGTVTGGVCCLSYVWDLGDGSGATGVTSVSHAYGKAGTYTVLLNVSDSSTGARGSGRATVVIDPLPSTSIAASPSSGLTNQSIGFQALTVGGTPPFSNAWEFGDGTSSLNLTPSHAYTAPGVYRVVLRTTDRLGSSALAQTNLTVSLALTVVAAASPTSGNTRTVFDLSASARGGIPPYTYQWNFGDGVIASGAQVSHSYLSGRSTPYRVTVNATDLTGASASFSLDLNVQNVTSTPPGGSAGSLASESSWWWWALLAAALVVLAVLVYHWRRGRGRRMVTAKAGPQQGEPPGA